MTPEIIDDDSAPQLTSNEEALVAFVKDHTDRWRDYRNQNYLDTWNKYERVFRGVWDADDKQRQSERSRIISPATQQAIETRHAEVMEAIFGQGEFFDIEDDLMDANKDPVDVEHMKALLNEDFKRDKILKSMDQIELMAEIYGTGIGEILIGSESVYTPSTQPISPTQQAFGVTETERVTIKLNPVNPKNFLFDPNGTSVDDCMGVAIERYTSIHKIAKGIQDGIYRKVDITSYYKTDELEPTHELTTFQDDKVLLLTYYGLVPAAYLKEDMEEDIALLDKDYLNAEVDSDDKEEYEDMVEAIVVICNGELLKGEKSPYMMQDRPVISYQDDTVPNRLLGRGTAEKAYNMQVAIDAQMRSHLDALALTTAPMIAMDATRLPRGAKFEVKPGKAFMTNGNPQEILFPFKFGTNDGQAMQTSKEFERMLLMATSTLDSQGMVTQGARDAGGLAPAVSGIIKKYKRTLVNFQEDFLIPFINKCAWRRMQFDPDRYPSVDVSFVPTATLGIIAREYEQQQIAFLIQTLGGNSPLTPVLMKGILKNSSLSNREAMMKEMDMAAQPNPEQQQAQMQEMQMKMQLMQSQIAEAQSSAQLNQAKSQKEMAETQFLPQTIEADVMKVHKQIELATVQAEAQMRQETVRSTNDMALINAQADRDTQVKLTEAENEKDLEMLKIQNEVYKIDKEAETKIYIARLNHSMEPEVEETEEVANPVLEAIAMMSQQITNMQPVSIRQVRDKNGKLIGGVRVMADGSEQQISIQ